MKKKTTSILSAALFAAILFSATGCDISVSHNTGPDPQRIDGANVTVSQEEIQTTKDDIAPGEGNTKENPVEKNVVTVPKSGEIGEGLAYELTEPSWMANEELPNYQIFKTGEEDFPYRIMITSGEHTTGGYEIFITELFYASDELVITVDETVPAPGPAVTQAFTYPKIGIKLSNLPGKVQVIDSHGMEYYKTEIAIDWVRE